MAHPLRPTWKGPPAAKQPTRPADTPGHTKSWRIDVYLYEGANETSAQVVLHGMLPAAL
jgi:hypothetical protein